MILMPQAWKRLELRDGVLYLRWTDRGSLVYQLVLLEQFRDRALQGVHDEVGHLGVERALQLMPGSTCQEWPNVSKGKLSLKKQHPWKTFLLPTHLNLSVRIICLCQTIKTLRTYWLSLTTSPKLLWLCQLKTRKPEPLQKLCGKALLSTLGFPVIYSVTRAGTQGDADDQEDELYSDEDKLYPSMQVPEIITRGPFI